MSLKEPEIHKWLSQYQYDKAGCPTSTRMLLLTHCPPQIYDVTSKKSPLQHSRCAAVSTRHHKTSQEHLTDTLHLHAPATMPRDQTTDQMAQYKEGGPPKKVSSRSVPSF